METVFKASFDYFVLSFIEKAENFLQADDVVIVDVLQKLETTRVLVVAGIVLDRRGTQENVVAEHANQEVLRLLGRSVVEVVEGNVLSLHKNLILAGNYFFVVVCFWGIL